MSDRVCPACGRDVSDRPERFRTCGRPPCVRAYRNNAPKATRKKPEWKRPDIYAPDTEGRQRVIYLWAASEAMFSTDRTTTSRVEWTAREAGVRPADVMAIARSVAA